MSWVEIRGFSYTYPGKENPVLQDISLSIKRGSFIVITGESGCGKSTLGKALAGFIFEDENPDVKGQIIVNGTDMSQIPLYEASEHVAYVHQNPEDQFCTLNVADEIAFGLENQCLDPEIIENRINQSLNIVRGLALKDRLLSTLSGGEKQKIAIASMLALLPDVLILDEPTSNLDPIATQHVFKTLYNMRKNKDLTVIIIEHKLAQLHPFNPEIFEMESGKIKRIEDIPAFQKHLREKSYLLPKIKSPRAKQTELLFELSDISVKINECSILNDINLKIMPGDFIALMGPNGSGKSTLLQTMMGFQKIETGRINAFGKELRSIKTSELVMDIGFIFQNPDHQLFTQSVWDEAILLSKNVGLLTKQKETQAKEWLNCMQLGTRRDDHPQRLSYGEKRRLNLLSVILHKPKLLLIDEFLIGQDMANAHAWMKFLQGYTQKGNAVVLINHHMALTRQYCSRIVFLDEGKILVDDSVPFSINWLSKNNFSEFLPVSMGVSAYA